jgi:lipid-A-disaccharide synthase-like uncharacterized protein
MNSAPSKAGKVLAQVGVASQASWVIGVIGTALAMMSAFKTLGSTGAGDVSNLSAAIGEALVSTAAGITVASVGLILVIISVTACRNRAPWLFWFCTIYGGLITLLLNPFGLFLLVYALVKRQEFLNPAGAEPRPSHARYSTRY